MNTHARFFWITLCALVLVLGSGALMAQVTMSIPSISIVPGSTLKIPVNVGDITADSVGSYQFVVTCDSTIIRFTGVDVAGTISEPWGATANYFVPPYGPGKMIVLCAATNSLTGSGVLVNLTATAQNKIGSAGLQMSGIVMSTTNNAPITVPPPKIGSVRTNNRPTVNAVTAKTVLEGDTLRFTATATDPDLPSDTLSFSLSNPPTGATIARLTGAFQWVPAFGQAGNYSVRVKVTDLAGASDSTTVSITVTHKNRPPTITAVSAKTVAERDTLRFTATATDLDLPSETLAFSLVNAPAGATIVASTGAFQWIPAVGQAANYSVRIKVTDLAGASDSTTVSITVTQAVNHRPSFVTKMVDQTVNEGSTLTFTYTATDPDPATTLVFSLLNPPTGASVTAAGAFAFTPPSNPSRTYAIVALVSDGSLADTARATVTVNRKPVFNSRTPATVTTVSRNVSQTFVVSVTDPDAGALTYLWKLNGATDQSGPSNTYVKTFSDPQATPKTVVCVFSNPVGLKDSTTWSFTITGIGSSGESIPTEFALGQNYPNPFNPTTTIAFDLPKFSSVTLEVFNVSGARVRSLLKGENIGAGSHTMMWDGRDESGRLVPSGAYMYRITAGDFTAWHKMTLLK